ncbi:MAG: hypothetical protein WCF22_03745 [Candidatus Sulfotelmatobacter sp.]
MSEAAKPSIIRVSLSLLSSRQAPLTSNSAPPPADLFALGIKNDCYDYNSDCDGDREMRRVLRPGGTALLIDMRRDVPLGVSRLNRWFMVVVRGMLIKRAYPLEEIRRMATEAGWVEPRIDISRVGFEAWMTR